MKPHELIIDHESCWGCRACGVACKQENHDPDGIRLIKVLEKGPRTINETPDFNSACADNVCLGHCIYFGDPDEIREEIAQKHSRRSEHPASGTVSGD
ncbi:MAG: hypothetical protein K9N10_19490 [Deltaproteobacteria bacterium]|nr:hypothetical protein [Deltaproteobacteria bacterium]